MTVCAAGLTAAIKDVILSGVNYQAQTGYYDCNKLFNGKDDNLCWAFAASNQLQRWQNKQYSSIIIEKSIPNGYSGSQSSYSLDITYAFVSAWPNQGGAEINGFEWWLRGGSSFPTGGAYWADYVSAETFIGEELSLSAVSKTFFMEKMDYFVSKDYELTLGVYKGTNAHALTLWGYSADSDSNSYWVYLSDSDDGKVELLKYGIYYDDANARWAFDDTSSYDGWYIGDMTYLTLGTVPEPAAFAAIFGACALFFAARRRRE